MCARAGVDAVGGVTLRRRRPRGLAQLASSATRVCSRAQVRGVRGPAGGVLSPCNELPQVPAAAVEEGPQGQTGGGAPRRLSPPALAPVSVRSAGRADPSAGGTGRWGQCARTCLGDRSARPAVGPAPPPGPRLFAPTQPRSPPSAAPTATCPHVKAGFVLRSGMHAEVSGAESLPRQPPCRSGQESGLRPEHCVWRAWILGRKRQVLFHLRNLPCIFTAEKRVPAPKVPRFFFFGLDGKFL